MPYSLWLAWAPMPLKQGTKLTIISGSHKGRKGYLHTHVHQTRTDWPQVLHHYYRITLVDDKGADARGVGCSTMPPG